MQAEGSSQQLSPRDCPRNLLYRPLSGGDKITTDQTDFFPTQSGPAVDVTAGVNARITDSIYLYGQYEYENADKFRAPWAINAGLRWQW